MADNTAIEWTDATWNPVTGCSVVSPGCTNCYAMKLAGTRLKHTPSRAGLTIDTKAGPVWNGQVRLNEQWLDQPLKWKRPRRIFVCAHGDLFHESVPDEWIDRVFAVMAMAPQHTFQILTKRAARMRTYCDPRGLPAVRRISELVCDRVVEERLPVVLMAPGIPDPGVCKQLPRVRLNRWPLPNVWLGVSAEDQKRADERIPALLDTPAIVRFVSAEPLLGPIEFSHAALAGIHWIIVGGESGSGARAMHPAWPRRIRDQCRTSHTAFFFKQWGNWADITQSDAADKAGWHARGTWMILDRHGDMDIPDHRWPDEAAGEVAVINVGKKAAGRLLDGVEHNDFPEVPA